MHLLIHSVLDTEQGVFACFRSVLVKRMSCLAEEGASPPQLKRPKEEQERKGLCRVTSFFPDFTDIPLSRLKSFSSISFFMASVAVREEGEWWGFRRPDAAISNPRRSDGGGKCRLGNSSHTMTPSGAQIVRQCVVTSFLHSRTDLREVRCARRQSQSLPKKQERVSELSSWDKATGFWYAKTFHWCPSASIRARQG